MDSSLDHGAAPRPPLTRDRVIRSGVAVADTRGIAALSMRKLAQTLGVEAMSLYNHVANKDDLLNGMVDLVFAEIGLPPAIGWQESMRQRAHAARDVLVRHPWAIGLLESRRQPGAATLAHHDAVLDRLRRAGFSVPLAAHAYSLLDSYIYGFVLQQTTMPFQSPAEMPAVATSMLEAFPRGAYPRLGEMIGHTLQPGYDYADEFAYGLELILAGLEGARAAEAAGLPSPTHRTSS